MKISIKSSVAVILLLIAFFENWLLGIIPFIRYFDEIISLAGLLYFLVHIKHDKGKSTFLIATSFLIILWGLLCNALFNIQPHAMAIIEDVFGNFKFIFIYLGVTTYIDITSIYIKSIIRKIVPVLKTYMLILFGLAFINLFFDIGVSQEVRYGIRGFSFVYGAAGHVINQCACFLLVLVAETEILGRRNVIWRALTLLLLLSTLKSRAFVLAAIYLALFYFFIFRKKKRLGLEIGIIGIVVAIIGYSQFETYFLASDRSPRAMFLRGAIQLVKEYFPFGTGFGTFGSSAAGHYYSQLYYALGFSTRWGMTPDNQLFINDNYLQMVFAQFGFIVGLVFCWLIYRYCRTVIRDIKRKDSPQCKMITWFFILNITLSSIQSSFLASFTVVVFSLFFFPFFYPNRRERDTV